ncbi:MAG: tetratricopeptide repeat protein [Ramlibacter sp.]|nr:tetratricopeptide repeat protein [Ramlibacter sp.]
MTRGTRRIAAAIAGAAFLASCALHAFTPDRNARAPVLEGYGRLDTPVTTSVPAARDTFRAAMLQAYAFNEVEAVRMFKAALALDPRCAMCAWGVAWQLGPNINAPGRGDFTEPLRYVDYALRHQGGATARERALIEALAVRYAHSSTARETAPLAGDVCGKPAPGAPEPAHPLDVAYAARLRALADAWPVDPDILALYAEAEMIATPEDDLWRADGKPNGRAGEVADRIEKLLPRHPDHTGLNHYMIHVADAAPVARRAIASADRMGSLAPQSPHLLHMPAHIYMHVGRYADATRVNQLAVAADVTLAQTLKAQGFDTSKDWRGHDLHFLWFSGLMEGRVDVALGAARQRAERTGASKDVLSEYFRSLPLLTLVRLERWDDVLAEPQPAGDRGLAGAMFEYARGVAQVRLGQLPAALQSLARLQAVTSETRKAHDGNSGGHRSVRAMLDFALEGLQAELALAQRRYDDALAHQAKVSAAVDRLDRREPPVLGAGSRLALGRIQSEAGRWAEAESTFREELSARPGSGWALRGLARALQAQGRTDEATRYRAELGRVWAAAGAALRSGS